tara:strand:+ start:1518 stop:1673 length:156 start_codon:yes stop_codon:yes gene_type:complete
MNNFSYICRMFKNKSEYYWDITRNMEYKESKEYLRLENKIKRIINKIKNKI